MINGFDISAYQTTTAPTAHFVFVKATEGKDYTSSKFNAQWASAKSRAKHRGAYHFARPEESSAESQAKRFLDMVKPVVGESVWLDLEASKLNQSQTNAWAKAFGDYVRAHAPGVTSGVYMGSGYATNGTGRDLNQHFDLWWYPQYPSTAETSTWRTSFTPWLPGGLTCGWKAPHIWQWTDNFNGLDANISLLTLDKLSGVSQPTPAPAVKPWPGRYLEVKSPLMHGSDVTWTQQRLNAHGAHLTIDSKYGAKTRSAVETFQKAHKPLTVDGVVGKLTWAALGK